MSNVWATMPYVQLSHKVFVICIKNRQNQIFSEMSLRDVMELPKCLSCQILNLFRTLSSWGSENYRPSAPLLYEVASHVKQLPFRPILLYSVSVARSSQKSYFFPQHDTIDIRHCRPRRGRFMVFRGTTVFLKRFFAQYKL